MNDADKSKTLQELESSDWGDPAKGETHLIQRCLALRRKPIADFSTEDLRLAIGQKMGLAFVVPIAIHHLQKSPLLEASLYPGDLLQNVLRVPFEKWMETEDLRAAWLHLHSIAREFLAYANGMDKEQREIFEDLIEDAERAVNSH